MIKKTNHEKNNETRFKSRKNIQGKQTNGYFFTSYSSIQDANKKCDDSGLYRIAISSVNSGVLFWDICPECNFNICCNMCSHRICFKNA